MGLRAAGRRTPRRDRRTTLQRQTRLDEDAIALLVESYAQGETVRALAGRFGLHRTTVMKHLENHGALRRHPQPMLSPGEIRHAVRIYAGGATVATVAGYLSMSRETARRALIGEGVRMRGRWG